MNWVSLIDPALSGRLCLTLLHSLWQVALLAAMVWCFDRLWRKRSVELRYLLHVGALFVALVALPVTYRMIDVAETHTAESAAEASPVNLVDTRSDSQPRTAGEETSVIDSPVALPVVPVASVEHQIPMPVASEPSVTPAATDIFGPKWMQLAPWILACYASGVAVMLVRLTIGIIRINRQAAHAVRIEDGPLVTILHSLAERWSMTIVPVLASAEKVLVPKLVGLVRPVILLPASAVSGLSPEELELILAHELAHVRRRDMWINLLQRVAEAVLFFNPGLWYLTRKISTLREYCCDDMVCWSQEDSCVESRLRYATVLLRVTELAKPQLAASADLAALAASGRSPSELRRRVARLLGESVREPLQFSRGGWMALLVVMAISILGPTLWTTYAEPTEEQQTVQQEEDAKPGEFRLTVVGPDGKPVPQAEIHLRMHPEVTADQILRGTFIKSVTYGPYVKTDDQGRLSIIRPQNLQRFNIDIKQPGYGPYWAEWSTSSPQLKIPDEFTAELDAGWSVGGVVVDEAGQPVEGAEVSPGIKYKKRPGDTSQLGVGTRITTDANGAWRFDHVPASQSNVHISVAHPEFAPLRQQVPRDGFGIKLDELPTALIELKEGLAITGTVTDDAGRPIEGALVKTKFHNDLRKATTDQQGHYRILGCEPRMTRVVVSATGKAIDLQSVRVSEDMKPVNFVMKPGGKIRVRVVDENGKGIPKARILFQDWREHCDYFEFDHVNLVADENGVWEWSEAPLDELQADIWSQDRMYLKRQPLKARKDEYVFSPPRALDISGRVIDAKTRKPVEKFRVTPGWRNIDNPRYSKGLHWSERDGFDASDGKYTIRCTQGLPTHIIRIEATGYRLAISRDIEWDEGQIDVDFELLPASDIAVKVVKADGEPAGSATIALGVAGSQISVKNGTLDLGSTYATILSADKRGHFSFPARTEPFQIVLTHPAGYAYLKSSEGPIPERIKLTAWARVEGVFRVGKQPQPNVGLSLYSNPIQSYGDDVPNIFTHHDVTTGKDGHYVFERVFPGDVGIERRIIFMVDEGAQEVTSAVRTHVTLIAGRTTTLDLGGTGRAVVGQLVPPAEFKEKVLWNFATVNAQVDLEPPPPAPEPPKNVGNDPKKRQVWWNNWLKSSGGRAWYTAREAFLDIQRKSTYITATVAKDGSFRINDVPPGKYVLSVGFDQHPGGSLRGVKFTVPPVEAGRDAEQVELGILALE